MNLGAERDTSGPRDEREPVRRVVLGVVIGLYLLSVGGLVGVVVERMRFDYRRAAVMARYDALLRHRNAALMNLERGIARDVREAEPAAVMRVGEN